jgi:N-acetylmuramoyl-L-alanine amidase
MKRAGFLAAGLLLALVPLVQPVSNAAPVSGAPVRPTAMTGTVKTSTAKPLAGLTIAIDPGHQLGNATHPRQINRKVWVGLWKICNTTGTATNRGYPEATFNFAVALRLRAALQSLGARVVMTRYTNSSRAWGPCINYRGAFGKAQNAVLKVSIHADGAPARDRGFHIITPKLRRGYTDDIYAASRRLGLAMRSGMIAGGISLSNYISHGWSVRGDQGTLNMSDIPTIIVETGNMRNVRDAALEVSSAGRQRYALALLRGIRLYLHR